eukprot:10750570-Ditylum_brightwellii.AAC.1
MKQLLTQESDKGNEKNQDFENETVKDTKAVVEDPSQHETGKNVMNMVILTCKQHLLQQRCAGYTMEELEPGENPTNQE